jgi:alpha-methylacyl-CoA racemase
VNLCKALGLEQYAKSQMDDDLQDEIREAFKQAFLTKTRDEWTALLAPNDTCVAPVLTIPELVDEPHFAARKVFMTAQHAEHGDFRQTSPVLAGGDRDQPIHQVRPFGESDGPALLTAAGYSTEEIEKLRAEGAIE